MHVLCNSHSNQGERGSQNSSFLLAETLKITAVVKNKLYVINICSHLLQPYNFMSPH